MKLYELVFVFDPALASAEQKELQAKLEKGFTILKTDDMGLLSLAYPLNGNGQAYFVSYLVEVDPDKLEEIKLNLKLEKGLAKFSFFWVRSEEEFLSFADMEKAYVAIEESEETALGRPETKEEEKEEEKEEAKA